MINVHRHLVVSSLLASFLLVGSLGCDGDEDSTVCDDSDGDGYGAGADCAGPDCDDSDGTVHRTLSLFYDRDGDEVGGEAITVCAGDTDPTDFVDVGGDCDDGNASAFQTWEVFEDNDGDNHGGDAATVCGTEVLPSGYVETGDDCDDGEATVYRTWNVYVDGDGDGLGSTADTVCGDDLLPAGYATAGGDCDDADPDNWLSCALCVDNDSDGYHTGCDAYVNRTEDCDDGTAAHWSDCGSCVDVDGDDYGTSCDLGLDCNDTIRDAWLSCATCRDGDGDGAYVGCDAYTELAGPDCDDGDYVRQDEAPFYVDADHDGVGTGAAVIICFDAFVEPFGYSPVGGDCDDDDPRVYPGAPEVPGNGIADGCAGDDLAPGAAEAIYVDSVGGSGAGDGSPTDPFATITQGLQESAAQGGLPLFVAIGTYAESVTTNVSIHGGRSASDWSLAGVSTVTAPLSGPGILVDSTRAVTLSDLEVTTSSASSPAIRLSDASGTNAIRLDQVSAHGSGSFSVGLEVSTEGRVVATGGSFSGTDFGIRLQRSATSYFEGLVVDNGLYIYGGQVTADTAIVRSRIAGPDVALHYQDGWRDDHLTIVATIIYSTLDSGPDCDAAWILGANLTLVDSTLSGGGCSASQGLVFGSDYDLTVVNSIIAATDTLSSYTSSRVTLSGTDLWTASGCLISITGGACVNGGAAAVDACDWTGCVSATAAQSVDPLFVVPGGELRLQDTSPVIDKGTDPGAVVPASWTAFDIDGQARPLGEGRDIGADEVK